MSEFSGKCDLWDDLFHISKMTDQSDWSKVKIYQDDKLLPISSLKDLIKYAPYITRSSCYINGEATINITSESWIDIEEKDMLSWRLKNAQRAYRSCKRKGIEFVPEDVAEKIFWRPNETEIEICRRVKEHPYSANIKGLKTGLHDYFRENWYDAMLKYGYSPKEAKSWIYGDESGDQA